MECLICYQEIEETKQATEQNEVCKCSICSECYTQWIIQQISDISYTIGGKISCGECNGKFSIETILNSDQLDQQQKTNISDIIAKKYIRNSKDYYPCPSPDCQNFGFIDKYCDMTEQIRCDFCSISYQLKKKEPFSFSRCVKNVFLNCFSLVRKVLFTKQCPTCSINIQKNGGCSHMTCGKCKAYFCWVCMCLMNNHTECKCLFFRGVNYMKKLMVLGVFLAIFAGIFELFGVLDLIIGFLGSFFGTIFIGIKFLYQYFIAYNLIIVSLTVFVKEMSSFFNNTKQFINYDRQTMKRLYKNSAFRDCFKNLGIIALIFFQIQLLEVGFGGLNGKQLIQTLLGDFLVVFTLFILYFLQWSVKNCKICVRRTQVNHELQVYEQRKANLIAEIMLKQQSQNEEEDQQQQKEQNLEQQIQEFEQGEEKVQEVVIKELEQKFNKQEEVDYIQEIKDMMKMDQIIFIDNVDSQNKEDEKELDLLQQQQEQLESEQQMIDIERQRAEDQIIIDSLIVQQQEDIQQIKIDIKEEKSIDIDVDKGLEENSRLENYDFENMRSLEVDK